MKSCSICGGEYYAKELCKRCYQRSYDQLPVIKAKQRERKARARERQRHPELVSEIPKVVRICVICGDKYFAKGLCKKCYHRLYKHRPEQKVKIREREHSPEGKAKKRNYERLPEVKLRKKIRCQRPDVKAKQWEYDHSPDRIASRKLRSQKPEAIAYQNEWRRGPKRKAYDQEYNQRPEVKVQKKEWITGPKGKAWQRSPSGKITLHRAKAKRRSLGHDVINPEYANEPGFHGHHIDHDHIIYIPEHLHRSVTHSLKRVESMERINTRVYAWLLGVST
jgi:hypothetical protein